MRNIRKLGKIRKINYNSQINIYNPLENIYLPNSYLTPRMHYNRAITESSNLEYPNNYYFHSMNNFFYNSSRPNSQEREYRYGNNISNKIFLPKQKHKFSRSLSFYNQNNIRNNYFINNIGYFNNSYRADRTYDNNSFFISNSINNVNKRFKSIDINNTYNNFNITDNYNYSNIINHDYNYYNNPNILYNNNNFYYNINDNYINNINNKKIKSHNNYSKNHLHYNKNMKIKDNIHNFFKDFYFKGVSNIMNKNPSFDNKKKVNNNQNIKIKVNNIKIKTISIDLSEDINKTSNDNDKYKKTNFTMNNNNDKKINSLHSALLYHKHKNINSEFKIDEKDYMNNKNSINFIKDGNTNELREKDNINNKEKIIKIIFSNNYENENNNIDTKIIDEIEPIKIEDNFESIYINENNEIDNSKCIYKKKEKEKENVKDNVNDNNNDNITSINNKVDEKDRLNQNKNKEKEKENKAEIDIINKENDNFMKSSLNNDEANTKKEAKKENNELNHRNLEGDNQLNDNKNNNNIDNKNNNQKHEIIKSDLMINTPINIRKSKRINRIDIMNIDNNKKLEKINNIEIKDNENSYELNRLNKKDFIMNNSERIRKKYKNKIEPSKKKEVEEKNRNININNKKNKENKQSKDNKEKKENELNINLDYINNQNKVQKIINNENINKKRYRNNVKQIFIDDIKNNEILKNKNQKTNKVNQINNEKDVSIQSDNKLNDHKIKINNKNYKRVELKVERKLELINSNRTRKLDRKINTINNINNISNKSNFNTINSNNTNDSKNTKNESNKTKTNNNFYIEIKHNDNNNNNDKNIKQMFKINNITTNNIQAYESKKNEKNSHEQIRKSYNRIELSPNKNNFIKTIVERTSRSAEKINKIDNYNGHINKRQLSSDNNNANNNHINSFQRNKSLSPNKNDNKIFLNNYNLSDSKNNVNYISINISNKNEIFKTPQVEKYKRDNNNNPITYRRYHIKSTTDFVSNNYTSAKNSKNNINNRIEIINNFSERNKIKKEIKVDDNTSQKSRIINEDNNKINKNIKIINKYSNINSNDSLKNKSRITHIININKNDIKDKDKIKNINNQKIIIDNSESIKNSINQNYIVFNERNTNMITVKYSSKNNIINKSVRDSKNILELSDRLNNFNKNLLSDISKIKCDICNRCIDSHLFKMHYNSHPTEILDWLYLGTYANACDMRELRKMKINYILNCAYECSNKNLSKEMKHLHLKIKDYDDFNIIDYFEKSNEFINKCKNEGGKILIHCKFGISRSSTLVIAFLVKYKKFTVDKALEFVREKRNIIYPNYGFMNQLYKYEKLIQGKHL